MALLLVLLLALLRLGCWRGRCHHHGCRRGFLFLGLPWWAFVLLLITPDVSMVGYMRGPRVGAIVYNVAHDLATGVAIVWRHAV